MSGRTGALMLAAGAGTRLRPLTDRVPKCLVPLAGRPLLEYWIDALEAADVREATINTHAHADVVRDYIGRVNAQRRICLREAHEPALLGSAGTIAANPGLVEGVDDALVIYADNLSGVDLGAMLAFHRAHNDPATMLLFRAADPRACGIVELDGDGRVVSFVEKPQRPVSDLANAGVYVFDASAYREIAAMDAFDLGFDVVPRFVGRMRGWLFEGTHIDVGTPEALARAAAAAPALVAQRRRPTRGKRAAVFLDRDGTVLEQVHYLRDPAEVRLAPGAGAALRSLRQAGFALVVVSNQSGVARGEMREADVQRVDAKMRALLRDEGVELDASRYCFAAPSGNGRLRVEHRDRKPGPGMLLDAAKALNIDVSASWMIGDMISDALAGRNAGCLGSLLVETGKGLTADEKDVGAQFTRVWDLREAAALILRTVRGQSATPAGEEGAWSA